MVMSKTPAFVAPVPDKAPSRWDSMPTLRPRRGASPGRSSREAQGAVGSCRTVGEVGGPWAQLPLAGVWRPSASEGGWEEYGEKKTVLKSQLGKKIAASITGVDITTAN